MPKSWSEVQSSMIEKAGRDEEYRRRLLEDPLRVAEEEAGEKLPDGSKIKVIEAEPETGYVVLPPRLPIRGDISDAALDSVAGGTLVTTALCAGGSAYTGACAWTSDYRCFASSSGGSACYFYYK